MKRLTIRNSDGSVSQPFNFDWSAAMRKLADYEDMEECVLKVKIALDKNAKAPTRAHESDAGYDIYSTESAIVPALGSYVFDTGVHIQIPEGYVGFLKSKSGLNVKHGIVGEGVIDSGYTGAIQVKLYNNSYYDYQVNAGDKISQIVLLPIITPELVVVDVLDYSDRGDNGFGSSGK